MITSQKHELFKARNAGFSFLLVAFLFSVFVNLLMLTGPLFMLQVYDRVLGSQSEETLVALILLVGFLYAIMAALDYARGRVLARYGARFQMALDARVFRANMRQATLQLDRNNTGLHDLEALQSLFTSQALLALFDMPWSPIFLSAIFLFHPMLGLLAIVGGTFLILVTLLNQLMTRNKVKSAQTISQMSHTLANQALQSSEIIESQGMRETMIRRWQAKRVEALKLSMSSSDWTGSFTAFTKAFRLFLQSAMLAAGAYYVLQGSMTAGAMIAGSILLGRALGPIEQTIGQWGLIQRGRAGWKSLEQLLENTPQPISQTKMPRPVARMSVRNLVAAPAGSNNAVLQNISFELMPGVALAVIGPSGAGKSTLVKSLVGLSKQVAGEVRLGGVSLNHYTAEQRGAYIGYLPQQVSFLGGTIAENIARMNEYPDAKAVVIAAKRANAHDMIVGLPLGYDTILDVNRSPLSGGQQQRIALARALYGDPELLVLDEPNSALDGDGSTALNAAVRDFKARQKAVVIMTHRPEAISECDQLIVMENGRIVANGPRDEILRAQIKNVDQINRDLKVAGAA